MAARINLTDAAAAVVSLAIGIGIAWWAQSYAGITADSAVTFLIVVPGLLYLMLSGKIREIRGPGGWVASFAEAASKAVGTGLGTDYDTLSYEEIQPIEKGRVDQLEGRLRKLDASRPIALTVVLDPHRYYDDQALSRYLDQFGHYPSFRLVVFLDAEHRYLAHMRTDTLKGLLLVQESAGPFMNVLNGAEASELLKYPGVATDAVRVGTTNAQALQEMARRNADALVVIDEEKHLKGIVEREQLTTQMLAALSG